MKTIYIFERGILGWQSIFGDWKNWPNQACVFINDETPFKAQTLTYFTGPILAGLTRHWRAKNFLQLLKQYAGCRIVLVAHSEGTATALAAMRMPGCPKIAELHLVCGACDADFEANGLNAALQAGRVVQVLVYVAGQDDAMKLENTYLGSLCFGLQTAGQPLGLKGARNANPAFAAHVKHIDWPHYGHSTCWEPHYFKRTMGQILNADACTGPTLFEKALSNYYPGRRRRE
jgi:pimeloyl-ACP methyl ester carboxylesterase